MKIEIKKIMQYFACLLCWLTLSPLFYYLAGKFKLFSKAWRIVLLLLSPLFLGLYFVIAMMICDASDRKERQARFANSESIERITGVEFPELEIQEYEKGRSSFQGDYTDKLVLSFKAQPDSHLINILDSLSQSGTNWSKDENTFTFSTQWGNGLPAPEGENDEEDMFFSLEYEKGNGFLKLTYGVW